MHESTVGETTHYLECMKKWFLMFILLLTACTSPLSTPIVEKQNANQIQRLQTIGALSVGINKTIDTNIPAAKEMNQQIGSLSETPTNEQVSLVLNSVTDKDARKKLQDSLDALITEKRDLETKMKEEIRTLSTALSKANAKLDDQEAELSKYDSPWYSIKHGFAIIIKRIAWGLGIFTVVFLVLRTFAASNPLIGAMYSVFSHIAAGVVKVVVKIFPTLFDHLKMVRQDLAESKEAVLTKIIDEIGTLKDDDNIKALKTQLGTRLDTADKQLITEIKHKLGWK